MSEARPNPDVLLAELTRQEEQQRRGKLKVFFGMSPGVGKTYAMLEEARKRAAEGLDVLIGYAEPHIRTETEALLLGLEILPYKLIEYRGATLKEFDLDAALARKPALVCVDELAHTNAPGMRHVKRWQDVQELLHAGINVYTTLNVQHLESVNDIVHKISGIQVRETLPDSVLEGADEVELVDIAPEELLERLHEGKVYRPEEARRAARHFFTKPKLIALRELALRTTAQRVDQQMLDARTETGAESTWPASERVVVCIGPSPMSARLVRSAKRLAAGLRAEWSAVYVQTPRAAGLPERDQLRLGRTMRLAEQLGARVVALDGTNVADEVIAYARAHNAGKIVVGKPARPRWREVLFGSVVDDLVRRSGDIDIHVIRGESEPDEGPAHAPARHPGIDWRGYAAAVAVTGITTGVGWPLYHLLGIDHVNVLMLYLVGVLWIAARHSRGAAVLTSVLSVALFDVYFVPPYYTFAVSDKEYVVTFGVMLLTAMVISTLTARVRREREVARRREQRTRTLLALSRDLSAARTESEISDVVARHVADVFAVRATVMLPDAGGKLRPVAQVDPKELSVGQWALEHAQIAGRQTQTLPSAAGTYVPLEARGLRLGVLAVFAAPQKLLAEGDLRELGEEIAPSAAAALLRARQHPT